MTQTAEFNQQIADLYYKQLPSIEISRRKVILGFSGLPASGKTTLARRLASDLPAHHVEHDAIRQLIRSQGNDPTKITIYPISYLVVKRIQADSANKFVILDASLDRHWQQFFDEAAHQDALALVIRLQVPPVIIRRRLVQRDRTATEWLRQIPQYFHDYQDCMRHVEADLTLASNYEYSRVLDTIRHKAGLEFTLADPPAPQ